ncbi:Aldo/keto reductase [Mycena floridula]|nr:Aldo/keto reductase [Mycena floridula]
MAAPLHTQYSHLGQSGLRVSVPIPWVLPESTALPVLKSAWDAGMTTVETANMYSTDESERIIGQFLKTYNIPRHNFVIITKASDYIVPIQGCAKIIQGYGWDEHLLINKRNYVNQGGLFRIGLFNQVAASLERLGTSYIDVLIIHRGDAETRIEETMKALHDLVHSGKVHYIGASNMHLFELAEMNNVAEKNGWTTFSCVEVEHSLLYRPEEIEMFAYCKLKGIGILGYSPLMDGFLARPVGAQTERTKTFDGTLFEKKRRDSDNEIIKRVQEIAEKRSNTKVSSPIVGLSLVSVSASSSVGRVQESVTPGEESTQEEIQYLEEP